MPMWHIRLPSAVFVRVLLSHPQCEYDASAPVPFGVLHDVEVSVVHLTMGLCSFCIWVVGLCVVVWWEGGGSGFFFLSIHMFFMRCQVLYSQLHIHVYYFHLCSHVFSLLQVIANSKTPGSTPSQGQIIHN